ncbi:hypothetical protein NW731_03975 [Mycoplasmopsis felis]|uniref:hypothetical protein n=1 Tax=Mycoplasmopsis felis TaxID=33923 RepID=UPI0021E0199D|nr:hypothetical protein [Mycoplasmopsis felis]MCU9937591.1 hypothetical protein [Mycoplasmopsis felis]
MENLKQLKTMYGRFFTITNPFKNNYFFKWYKGIEKYYDKPVSEMTFLEPFWRKQHNWLNSRIKFKSVVKLGLLWYKPTKRK